MIDATNYNKHKSPRGMPDGWPILTGKDINQDGAYYEWIPLTEKENKNCGCLLGWTHNMTKSEHTDSRIKTAIRKAIRETLPANRRAKFIDIADWSDSAKKAKVARVWNRAGALLGYTEGNPMTNRIAA